MTLRITTREMLDDTISIALRQRSLVFLAFGWAAGVASGSCAKLLGSPAVSILSGPPPQPPPLALCHAGQGSTRICARC
jgi:hypothetical protein